jgi:hypothetical protein
MCPDRSGAFNDWSVAPKVIIRALTPLAPVSTTDSTEVPSAKVPNASRRAVAPLADPAIAPAPNKPTIATLQLIHNSPVN